jgi:hypothetical protein
MAEKSDENNHSVSSLSAITALPRPGKQGKAKIMFGRYSRAS